MDVIQAASVREWITLSEDPRTVEVLGRVTREPRRFREKPFCVDSGDGFNLQAGVRIKASDREGLERLCRYVLRPPFAMDRLERLPDGRISYEFKRPRPDGATHAILTPIELLEKLAALVPPPRSHLVRYHGILEPHAARRTRVVPGGSPEDDTCQGNGHGKSEDQAEKAGRQARIPWAELMRKTMKLDVLSCPRYGGRMELIAMIEEAEAIGKILKAMGLPTEPPRPPPQKRFEFGQDSIPLNSE